MTVGIPTKNRNDKISNCLKALENQLFQDFNIIVVDGSKNDKTKRSIQSFLGSLALFILNR